MVCSLETFVQTSSKLVGSWLAGGITSDLVTTGRAQNSHSARRLSMYALKLRHTIASLHSLLSSAASLQVVHTSNDITTRRSTRSLRSSSAPLLHVPFRRTSFGKRSFSTAALSVWSSLPVSVQNCDTLTLFKSRLKAHLFSSVYAS